MSLPPALQNKNVQIGVIAVAVLILLVFVFTQLLGGNSTPDTTVGMGGGPYGSGGGPPYGPGGPAGGPGGTGGAPGGSSSYPGMSMYPGSSGGYPGGSVAGGYGSDVGAGGAPLTGAGGKTPTKKAGPRPPSRHDPFKMPNDQIPEPVPISAQLPPNQLYIDNRIKRITEPTPDQYIRDTPDPPMRMAGALWGNRVYGVLEINGQTQVVHPGDRVGIYRVERVERDKILLSRPSRKGRRVVEALLAGNPGLAAQYPTGDANIPGGPMGYGGSPGGGSGGGPARSGG